MPRGRPFIVKCPVCGRVEECAPPPSLFSAHDALAYVVFPHGDHALVVWVSRGGVREVEVLKGPFGVPLPAPAADFYTKGKQSVLLLVNGRKAVLKEGLQGVEVTLLPSSLADLLAGRVFTTALVFTVGMAALAATVILLSGPSAALAFTAGVLAEAAVALILLIIAVKEWNSIKSKLGLAKER